MEFVAEKESNFTNVEEALKSVNEDYKHENIPLNLCELRLNQNYDFIINSNTYKPTEWAFESLLKALSIPVNFGKKIPNDLLGLIVHRLELEAEKEDKEQVVMITQGNDIWNITKKEPKFKLQEILSSITASKVTSKIKVGVRGVIVDVDLPITTEPVVGDIVKVGTRTMASETGGPKPKANLALLRLVCTNGAVASENFAEIKWGKSDYNINDFTMDMGLLETRARLVTDALVKLPSTKIDDMMFHYLWNAVRSNLVDKDDTDKFFKITEDERQTYIVSAKDREKRHLAAGPTEVNAWDAYNNISRLARDLTYRENDRLARVAGFILDSVRVDGQNN